MAAQSGQSLQVELLVVYGADPGAADSLGKTPADYAGQVVLICVRNLVFVVYRSASTVRVIQRFVIPLQRVY